MFYQTQPPNFFDRLWRFLKTPSILSMLILINSAFFLVIGGWELIGNLFLTTDTTEASISPLVVYTALPAELTQLVQRPWTLLTHMFVHQDLMHFLFNMITLYFAGSIFRSFMSQRQLAWIYLLGGLGGAAFYLLAYNTLPAFETHQELSIAVGASAAIMAVLFASAAYAPSYSINLLLFGRLKLIHLALLIIAIDIVFGARMNPGGFIAHSGGGLIGLIAGFSIRRAKFPKVRKVKFHKPSKQSKPNPRPETDEAFLKRKAADQAKVDRILDKISQGGYQSLSKEEKEFLFRHR